MRLLSCLLALGCVRPGGDPDLPSDTAEPTVPETPGPAYAAPPCASPRVVINELQASNVTGITDADGDTSDWIELYNADTVEADLSGWWVTDDRDAPRKWVLPAGATVAPGGFVLLYASGKDIGGDVLSWDTKIDVGHEWRYRELTGPVAPGWQEPGYDDGDWAAGPSGFGRGDDDDATVLSAGSVQVRTTLSLTDEELSDVVQALLHVDYDDGFVAWINGVEVARSNLGTVGVEPGWDELADTDHEAMLYQGERPPAFEVDPAVLRRSNTVALMVADVVDSSDLTLIPLLTLGYGSVRDGHASAQVDLTPELHTNFELKATGETVWLFDADDCPADRVDPGPMRADQSHGRFTDGAEERGYFLEATPGASNTTEARSGFADPPELSPPPGFYPGGVEVSVAVAPGARLVMLPDGYEPIEADATHPGTVTIDGAAEGVVLRARAVADGLWPSPVTTGTYLVRDPGPLPTVSLVTDPVHLWDWDTGIYVLGEGAEVAVPHYGANYWQDWERPVHAALWEPDGALGFAFDAGLEIHGGWTRAHAQKSLKVKMRSGYGTPSIGYDVFPGLGVTAFANLTIRNGGNDWHGCSPDGCSFGAHLRDGLMQRIAEGVDADRLAYRPAEVYLNGEYWGVYNLRERPDVHYIEAHHGQSDIDLLERGTRAIEGDTAHYRALLEHVRTHDLSDPAAYDTVRAMMDVGQYANYMALEIWFDNTDWPGNNVRMWRPRTADGRWRWLLQDTDFGLGLYDAAVQNDTLGLALDPYGASWPNPPASTELFRRLLTSEAFRAEFLDRYADLMNTLLQPARTQGLLADARAEIAPLMGLQFDRWGAWSDGITTHQLWAGAWAQEVDDIDRWLGERTLWATMHALEHFELDGTYRLQLDVDPPGAGTFQLAALAVEAPFAGDYFLGVPVTVTAVPEPGFAFVGWSDGALPADPTVVVDPDDALQLTALFH